ncbi:MAG: hypothetical protein ACRC37_02480 [Lentisphaeria bacterium]
MNRDDLNFFEPLNWKAESTVSQKFIIIVAISFVFLASGLFYYLLLEQQEEQKRALDKSSAEIAKMSKPANLVTQKIMFNKFMDEMILDNLRKRVKGKVYFAPLLSKFQEIIPKNMIIKNIAVSAVAKEVVKVDPKAKAGAKVAPADLSMNYRMVFSGITTEEQAMGFCEFLVTENGLGKYIKSAVIQDWRKDRASVESNLDTEFTIECIVVGEEVGK